MRTFARRKLPKTGGLSATMLVLIDEDSLMGRVEKAGLLDTGKERRFHTKYQRYALIARDKGCRA